MFLEEKKSILCDAVPFCFGPISKLLTISEKLNTDHRVSMLVSGTSKTLADKGAIDFLTECNTENNDDLLRQELRFKMSDLFINIMNPVSAKFAEKFKVPQAQVDSLFWMWESIPKEILDSELYFIQNFEGVEKQLQKYYDKIKNPILVGPIVKNPPEKTEKKNKLLINFGGMESASIKIGVNSNYPFIIANLIRQIENNLNFDEVVCVGNGKIIEQTNEKVKSKKIRFEFLSHDNFIKELAESKMLITSPGLTTSFEAFNAGTPAFFLPPQNYSQYWNLNGFKTNNIANHALNWSDYYSELEIKENEEELSGINKVLGGISKFEKDSLAQKKFCDNIVSCTNLDSKELKKVETTQKKYFNALGGNGTQEVIDSINSFLGGI
jgi:hypothetical protein